ncbi:hypothetical protein [Clostridium sp. VAP51]|uniref:hypothetical protein n=1 Tax=Clostridium sp. VAP51 TaxID=2949978 RepID=UPI00207A05AF|nr:hypothetical protein [Clostridium sp. VAP51]
MNRLVNTSYDGRQENFTYDKIRNRLSKTTNDITEKYVYNVKNQLKELHNKNGANYFTYDKQGNTLVSRYAHIKMVRKQPPKSFLYRRFKN